jgi:hypothetical protein
MSTVDKPVSFTIDEKLALYHAHMIILARQNLTREEFRQKQADALRRLGLEVKTCTKH